MSSCPHFPSRASSYRSPLPSASLMPHSASTTPFISTTPFTSITDADNLFAPLPPPETPHLGDRYTLGTRKSNLALIQTNLVATLLSQLHPSSEFGVESMTTVGDRNQMTPLHLLTPYSQQQPAKSLWTDELEVRLGNGHFDMLVHSLKDVPTTLKEGCEIGCMLRREDPRDCLVVKKGGGWESLEELPEGSVVGTGSVRRVAQLKRAFPGLRFEDMRGNLNTRLTKLDSPTSPFSALILATSGLTRLGSASRITSSISSPTLYHAVGQGALGVEIRVGDPRVRATLRGVGHWQTEWRCAAERGCLRVLEGGCSVPVGVESALEELDPTEELSLDTEDFVPLQPDSPMLWFSGIVDLSLPLPSSTTSLPLLIPRRARLTLRTCVTSLDGSSQVVHSPPPIIVGNYQQAERWGEICALDVRERGGGEILEEVGRVRRERERKDLERAIEKSRAEGRAGGIGSGMPGGGGGGLRPTLLRNMRNGLPDGGGFTSAKIDGDGGGEGEEDSGEMVQDGDEGGHRGLDGLISTLTGMGLENRDKGGGDGDRAGVS